MRTFHPPRRVLLGPGPSEVSPRVLLASARPTIGWLDPAFAVLTDEIRAALSRLFHAPHHACLALPGPGAAGMEAAIVNLLEPGQAAVVAINGVFGRRMAEMAERAGAEVIRVEHAMGEPVDPARVEAALWARGARLLAFVHAELSTGVMSEPGPLCALAREHGALSVVDCVGSLGGVPVEAAGWGADVLYSGSQACLSAPAGLAPFALGPRAREAIAARKTRVRSWLYDLDLAMGAQGAKGARDGRPAAPVNALYGLHEALLALEEEGQDAAFARHRRVHAALAAAMEAMGLRLPAPAPARAPMLNVVEVPAGVDEARVRAQLLERFGLEIGGGLGEWAGRVWRIGLMGASAVPANVRLLIGALAHALAVQGHPADARAGLDAAEARLGRP